MSTTNRRTERMASLIRSELSRVLVSEVSDPSLKDITITDVELTKDLKQARIFYFSHLDMSEQRERDLRKGFSRAQPYFKRKIQEHLKLRYIPNLEFERDTHTSEVIRLESLLGNPTLGSEE